MPAQVLNGPAVAVHMYQALFGQAPSNALYASYISQIGSTDGAAFAASIAGGFASTTDAALAAKVLANLGVTATTMPATATVTAAAAYTALETALTSLFTGYGVAARGQIILNMTNLLANLEGDVTFGTIATAYNTQTLNNFTYSSNTANTAAAAVTTATAVAGQTFTLTTAADTFSPDSAVAANKTTAGDDVFRSVGTITDLGNADFIDGGAGNDTLNLTAVAGLASVVKPVLKNVETINVMFDAGGQINLADSTGYTAVNSKASTNLGAVGGAFLNIKLGTQVGVVDGDKGGVFTYASVSGATDAATLSVADAATAAPVKIEGIEKVTINSTAGSITAVTANSIALTAAQADTITVTGDQALTLALSTTSPSLALVDATAFTKALTLTVTAAPAATTSDLVIKTGVGADSVTITAATTADSKVTVDLGAGNDTLAISDFAFNKITLGDGNDTVNFDAKVAAANHKKIDLSTAAKLAASVTEITDFATGKDVLNIVTTTATKIVLTGTQLSGVAVASSLVTATTAVLGVATAGGVTAFQYGGDTYVLIDEGTAGTLDVADSLIKLTGVTSLAAADLTVA